ncbi:putative Phosphotransferase [Seiridium cardinale]|uniref:Phosphotransferase n=1 Tax=Seiridium cardinale TaxID=138064 RepID=A0ABR2XLQ7_9PEZI
MDVADFLQPLRIDVPTVQQLSHEFRQTFQDLATESLDQFLPTPITESILRPTAGSEKGTYLAIDIGGTNLRVGFIELLGSNKEDTAPNGVNGANGKINGRHNGPARPPLRRVLERSWPILEHLKNEKADALFAWIGARIAEVVHEGCGHYSLPRDKALHLGVTFSFPMVQNTLSEAKLMAMGKGFAMTSNMDLDLGSQLSSGYITATEGLNLPPIEIVAIANDSVATLVSFVYQAPESPTRKASMGLICGTGCNATIPLRKDMLHHSKLPVKVGVSSGDDKDEDAKVAVNTEWSINGTAPALRKYGLISRWDKRLDDEGDKPGFQPLEYMTAGRYLGELGRLILVEYLTLQLGWPLESLPVELLRRFSLSTTFLSHFKPRDAPILLKKLKAEFPAVVGGFQWTEDVALVLYSIAKAIEVRAAGITAAATIGLLACAGDLPLRQLQDVTNRPAQQKERGSPSELVVGYTGGCIEHFQDYLTDCQQFLDEAIEAEFGDSTPIRVKLTACHDGGITGAGVLAGNAMARSAATS